MRSLPLVLPALFLATGMHSSAQTTEDGFIPKVTGAIRCVTAMPDGRLWIGGDITQVNTTGVQNLACLQWDGVVAKGPNVEINGTVLSLLPVADKSLWVGGAFSEVSGQPRMGLARLRSIDGVSFLDNEFTPEFDGEVRCLLADGDGVLVGGNFKRVNGLPRAGVVRLLLDGEVDAGFDAKLEGELGVAVNAMGRQPDGKVVLGGLFDMAGQQAVTNLARLYPSGALDSRFLGSADGEVHALGVQVSSDIVIGGDFLNASDHPAAKLARLDRHGAFVNTLNGLDERVNTIGIQPDGKVLVGGRFGPFSGAQNGGFLRLTAQLQMEKTDPRVVGEVFCCLPQSDGRILVGGTIQRADTRQRYGLARLDNNMLTDDTVGAAVGVTGSITTAVQQPDEKLIFGGPFTRLGGYSFASGLVRATSNAVYDPTVHMQAVGDGLTGIQVRRDQKVWVFGSLSQSQGLQRSGLVRLTSTGGIDTAFNGGFVGPTPLAVNAIADQPSDMLLVGGNFTQVGQTAASMIVSLTNTGGYVRTNLILPVVESAPTDFLLSPTGELTVTGMLPAAVDLLPRPFLKRYGANGSLVSSYQANSGGKLNGMCRQPDGTTLVWGLRPLGGEGNLVRLNTAGKLDGSFNPYFSGEVSSVSVQADGSMLVLGAFSTYRGGSTITSSSDGFVHLGPDLRLKSTTSVTSMSPPGLARGGLVQADGKFLFWGGFKFAKGGRAGLARLSTVVPASQELGFVPSEKGYPKIAWQRSGSAPQVERVWFSWSANGTTYNGTTYNPANEGRWANGRWEWEKFDVPARTPVWIRAEGRVPSTGGGDAGGLVQSIRQVFLEGEVDVALNEKSLISGEADVVNFGGQIQGVPPVSRTFTITNRGNHWLTLGAPVVPEGFMVSAPFYSSLSPGEQTTIQVTSDLSRVGTWTGELVIPSDDIDEREFVIPLKSEALTPLRTLLLKPRAAMNRKTGLREQTIRVRNAAGITYQGFRVIVGGLPQGVEVRNANSQRLEDGRYEIVVNEPLGPFANMDLKLEYFFPPKTKAKLIPRITTEVLLLMPAE